MFLTFKKWVKNIQTAGYNGARTVCRKHVRDFLEALLQEGFYGDYFEKRKNYKKYFAHNE